MLKLRFFISTYFTEATLLLTARAMVHGIYNEENDVGLHFIINRRTTLLNEWLEDNRGHQDVQQFE